MITVRVFKDPNWMGNRINLAILDVNPETKKVSLLSNFELKELDPAGSVETGKMLPIEIEAAQKLMDELWDCGLRPSEGSGSAGQLAAVQKHLEDMRTIVFKSMDVST